MKQRKFCLIVAMLLVFTLAFPVQAASPPGWGGGDSAEETVSESIASISGGDAASGIPSVSGGDAGENPGEDLSGKTVNLALIIDTTGSMYSYINSVVENLSEFVRYIESTGVNFRLSLIDYRDITCNEDTVVHTFDHSVWSRSTDQIVAEMQALHVNGGGDEPETLVDALGYLVDESVMTFNSDAAKFAIVLTDATYKIDNTHGIESMENMIAALQAKGIKVSVMTESYCFHVYEALTSATGGILCPVYDFTEALREYALSIIRATADSEVDDSIHAVTGISAEGPASVKPNYVYTYNVSFTPSNATDKGVYWYVENSDIAQVLSASGTMCDVRGVSEGSTRLVAVSRDGGYTSAIELTVSESAPVSDRIITSDYNAVKEALGEDAVRIYEYHVADSSMVTGEQQREIFTAIKGKEKTFTFVFADGDSSEIFKWSFHGTKITDENQTLDMGVTPGAGNETVLGAVTEDVAKLDIHFNHSGSLPGEAAVTVSVKDVFTEGSLYLYYYNAATGALELAAEGVTVEEGYATFPLTHCSDYILTAEMLRSLIPDTGSDNDENAGGSGTVEEDVPKPDTGFNNNENTGSSETMETNIPEPASFISPKTGEESMVNVLIMVLFALAGMVFLYKKFCLKKD